MAGEVMIECDSCIRASISTRGVLINLGGALVISSGLAAVYLRHQRLLYVYGTCMLFFSLIIGLTAVLSTLESPVLEVAVGGVSPLEEDCMVLARRMLEGARDLAMLNSLGCLVDSVGAILAIRSKELFTYEEIASQHAEVARASSL
jgi:hypothetical protein